MTNGYAVDAESYAPACDQGGSSKMLRWAVDDSWRTEGSTPDGGGWWVVR